MEDPRILLMAVAYAFGIVLTAGLSLLVFLRSKRGALSFIFQLMNGSIFVVEISMLLITLASSERLLSLTHFLNMFNIFIVVFMAHWTLEIIGKAKERLVPLSLIYLCGSALFAYYLFRPEAFLLPAVPKLYFSHYFEPAAWYTVMRLYFGIVGLYFLYELFRAFRGTLDKIVRNRIKYVFAGILFGMLTGNTALLLVYDIPFDPLFSALFPLYTIPFVYAIIRYELMDITLVAKRAALYALTVSIVAAFLGLVDYADSLVVARFSRFPRDLVPLAVSLAASSLGWFIWLRLKESEMLKYEFITVVTHKFRTPLTEIKWTIERLLPKATSPELAGGLSTIAHADAELVELTNMLVETAETEAPAHSYPLRPMPLTALTEDVLQTLQPRIAEKRLRVSLHAPNEIPIVRAEPTRLAVLLETVLENAVFYTPAGGTVDIKIRFEGGEVIWSVQDSGMGIARANLPHIFEKFYRSDAARHIATEGMGIGLSMAKRIAERHGGSLSAASAGAGKGAEFTLRLPAV